MISALAFTACHKEKVKEEALLAGLLSQAVRTAGQGNCAVNINLTGLSYGTLVQVAVSSGTADTTFNGAKFLAHFNSLHGSSHTAATLNNVSYNRKYDAFFTDKDTWNAAARATYLRTIETQAEANNLAGVGLSAATYGALKGSRGSAIMACARIPKSSCSYSALTTASRTKDLENQVTVYNTVATAQDCKKTPNIEYALKTNLFNGAYAGEVFSFVDGSTFTPVNDGPSGSNTTSTSVLAERSYPKFGTLVSLGFGQLMPMIAATSAASTAYALTTDAYTQGSNITATEVVSCEALGLPSGGPTATAALPLSPVREVAYSFSTQGQAASAYAAARTTLNGPALTNGSGVASTQTAFDEATSCNNGLRASYAPPLAIGGGKLGAVTGTTGDGGSTTLLTSCIYGLTSAGRAAPIAVIGATLAGISHCPAAASAGVGSVKFADTGLQTLADFPNN
ncbi:hypothetical protein [Leptospira idonii]|uniref:Lipoprotein n=1 Tax=Leptospira idonii TaxID=1193500 RepID=A0A4R9M1U2_9LEPT|nr:hypothetical protein [Leptospira idonii]TGN20700.1 hypothetical protein EHS15_02245 [Leptospira idonii]